MGRQSHEGIDSLKLLLASEQFTIHDISAEDGQVAMSKREMIGVAER